MNPIRRMAGVLAGLACAWLGLAVAAPVAGTGRSGESRQKPPAPHGHVLITRRPAPGGGQAGPRQPAPDHHARSLHLADCLPGWLEVTE
jgi:hypothetical protein